MNSRVFVQSFLGLGNQLVYGRIELVLLIVNVLVNLFVLSSSFSSLLVLPTGRRNRRSQSAVVLV